MLRAATKDRLPAPFTLPFGASARQSFDRLVEARNSFMHPRGTLWHVSQHTVSQGLPVATGTVRHLILTQPVLSDLVSPDQQNALREDLEIIDALADFLDDPDLSNRLRGHAGAPLTGVGAAFIDPHPVDQ